ncbi:permease prefix domain 1-containing protein [Micromonospora sp. WMMC241]|uniref:permease prefix domain 1-containing protein n=1 Tax=Micromonospora sp. WMMC241 TaxID=3015159 RepID=UPI0022B668C4|nr:permease prefix domain 1-containing protein [Micromonospora sp. WMMC241]MCZ7439838.1 permease prefix domain 1-containing protein [Micromonospora sp. WMMC241]
MRVDQEARVEDRLRELSGRLHGPTRLKADLLTEARHALEDAAEAYRDGGLPRAEAERRAVAEFGSVAQLAPGFQAELAACALRGLALRTLAVAGVLIAAGDLTWQGSSWSAGPRPPSGYLLLSAALNGIWAVVGGLALAGLLLGALAARRPSTGVLRSARAVGFGLTGGLLVGALAGGALFGWSVRLWDAALTWPPMIIGAVVVSAAWFALARSARWWLLSARGARLARR